MTPAAEPAAPLPAPAAAPAPGAGRLPLRRRRSRWPWLLLLIALAGGGWWWGWGRAATVKSHLPKMETAVVDRGPISSRATATGTLSALVTVQVGSQVSGRIQEVLVDYNSLVKQGDLLVKLDPQLFQAAVAQAKANRNAARGELLRAKAQAGESNRQIKRLRQLLAAGAAAGVEVDTAELNVSVAAAAVLVAQGRLEQAEAQLESAELNLSFTLVRSPISGIVIAKTAEAGQTVAASLQSPNLVQIAQDLSKMQVDTNVSEADIGKLRDGMEAHFRVDAWPGELFSAKVRQIRNAPQMLQNVVTYDAVLDVDNPQGKLKPGMTANVTFTVARREDAVRVPNTALRFKPTPELLAALPADVTDVAAGDRPWKRNGGGDGDGATGGGRGRRSGGAGGESATTPSAGSEIRRDVRTVWALKNGQPRPVKVRLGLTDGSLTEVLWGLQPGDQVITEVAAAPLKAGAIPGLTGPAGGPPGGRRGGM